MTRTIKSIGFNPWIAGEVCMIFLLWLASVAVSMPVFNRPLDAHEEWQTAHTLVSMRAFEERGFWKLLGASTFTPNSREFHNIDVTSLGREEGIYLSYPSLWLDLPYAVFKLLNLFLPNLNLSPQFLQIYHLIVNRLICGLFIFYLYLEIMKIIAGNRLSDYKKKLIAFLGLTGWMFSPPVMYWTQNAYFADQAVLLPIYTMFLIALKCRFKFEELSKSGIFLLLMAVILACGIDWYGWVAVAVIMSVALIDKWLSESSTPFLYKAFLKKYLSSIKYILIGMVFVGLTFLAQMLYYKDSLNDFYKNLFFRTGMVIIDIDRETKTLTYFNLIAKILLHWTPYYPQIIPYRHIYLFTALLLILGSLYYFYRNSTEKRLPIYAYILIFLVPILQIFLLKQHSYQHDFSAFKMALPIVFSLFILPTLFLNFTFKVIFNNKLKFSNAFLSIFVVVLGLATIFNSRSELIKFAGVSNKNNQDLGFVVTENIQDDDLPIAQNPQFLNYGNHFNLPDNLKISNNENYFNPRRIWYTKRYVYTVSQIKNLRAQEKLNAQTFKDMTPVFLAFGDEPIDAGIEIICQGKWIKLVEKLDDREVIACRNIELHRLFE